jgi:arginine-tRNA-protein transferase
MMSNSESKPEIFTLTESPRACSYLPDETAALQYRFYPGLSPDELEALLQRGWRRFGAQLFRPACAACRQCVPTRVDVQNFRPSKSQRRALRRNERIQVSLHRAALSQAHVDLYNAWHADMTLRKDWRPQSHSLAEYAEGFLLGDFPSAHELRYFDSGKLVGVSLIDLLPHSLSSIYFYHDPRWRDRGPGTFSLLCELDLARRLGLVHAYLGYWIARCPSMAYKNRYHPQEILQGRPADDEAPIWTTMEADTSAD